MIYVCTRLEIYFDPTNHEVMESYFSLMWEYLQISWKKSGRRNLGFLFTFLLVLVFKIKETRPRSEYIIKRSCKQFWRNPLHLLGSLQQHLKVSSYFISKLESWQFSGWFTVVWHQSEPNTSQFIECNHFESFVFVIHIQSLFNW